MMAGQPSMLEQAQVDGLRQVCPRAGGCHRLCPPHPLRSCTEEQSCPRTLCTWSAAVTLLAVMAAQGSSRPCCMC